MRRKRSSFASAAAKNVQAAWLQCSRVRSRLGRRQTSRFPSEQVCDKSALLSGAELHCHFFDVHIYEVKAVLAHI